MAAEVRQVKSDARPHGDSDEDKDLGCCQLVLKHRNGEYSHHENPATRLPPLACRMRTLRPAQQPELDSCKGHRHSVGGEDKPVGQADQVLAPH